MGFHPREGTSLWRPLGSSSEEHLSRIVGETKLNFEELATVLCQIEACLNSRPLIPLPGDVNVDILTPGHFLIGKPVEAIPDPDLPCRQ